MSLLLLLRGHRQNNLLPGGTPITVVQAAYRTYVEPSSSYEEPVEEDERFELIQASDRKYLISGKKRTFYINDE